MIANPNPLWRADLFEVFVSTGVQVDEIPPETVERFFVAKRTDTIQDRAVHSYPFCSASNPTAIQMWRDSENRVWCYAWKEFVVGVGVNRFGTVCNVGEWVAGKPLIKKDVEPLRYDGDDNETVIVEKILETAAQAEENPKERRRLHLLEEARLEQEKRLIDAKNLDEKMKKATDADSFEQQLNALAEQLERAEPADDDDVAGDLYEQALKVEYERGAVASEELLISDSDNEDETIGRLTAAAAVATEQDDDDGDTHVTRKMPQ